MVPLNSAPRYLRMRAPALMIMGPLSGLVYIVLVPVIGAIIIVPLVLYRAGQLLGRAVRRDFSGRLHKFNS